MKWQAFQTSIFFFCCFLNYLLTFFNARWHNVFFISVVAGVFSTLFTKKACDLHHYYKCKMSFSLQIHFSYSIDICTPHRWRWWWWCGVFLSLFAKCIHLFHLFVCDVASLEMYIWLFSTIYWMNFKRTYEADTAKNREREKNGFTAGCKALDLHYYSHWINTFYCKREKINAATTIFFTFFIVNILPHTKNRRFHWHINKISRRIL